MRDRDRSILYSPIQVSSLGALLLFQAIFAPQPLANGESGVRILEFPASGASVSVHSQSAETTGNVPAEPAELKVPSDLDLNLEAVPERPKKSTEESTEEQKPADDSSVSSDVSAEESPLAEVPFVGVEISGTNRLCSPILPKGAVTLEGEDFFAQVQRSRKPGISLESVHFLVEGDSFWTQNASELVQVVQTVEMIRHEAELTASLWRRPLPSVPSATPLSRNAKKSPLTAEFRGNQVRLRVLTSLSAPVSGFGSNFSRPLRASQSFGSGNLSAGSFELTDDGAVLTLEIPSIQALQQPERVRMIRAAVFQSMLYDGKESVLFPLWLQAGLTSIFASDGDASGSMKFVPIPLSELYRASGSETSVANFTGSATLWLRYFLTSEDAQNFFPFWAQLGDAFQNARQQLEREVQQKSAPLTAPKDSHRWQKSTVVDSQKFQAEIQNQLEFFARQLDRKPGGESFEDWRNRPDAENVQVFWNPEVEVLNVMETETENYPTILLSDDLQAPYLEMAQVLRLVWKYQRFEGLNPVSVEENQGVRIYEYGKSGDFRTLSTVHSLAISTEGAGVESQVVENGKTVKSGEPAWNDEAAENSESGENSETEDSSAVTSEDLQRLENVYRWFTAVDAPQQTLGFDGTILSARLFPRQTERLFHPQNRAYLLQELNGDPVLSATFEDGSVLHVILEKKPSDGSAPRIRILGTENPEEP